jgi:hypothetical protein
MRSSILLFSFVALLCSSPGTQSFAATEPYWNWRNPLPQGNDYNGVAYGNGRFVAVGAAGTITTSADGRTWAAANSGVIHDLACVAFGNGRFVAKGYVSGASGLLVSDDGLSWTVPAATLPDGWRSVTLVKYAGDRFFAMANSAFEARINVHIVATSTDGVTWTQSPSATAAKVGRIAFAGGVYVGQDMLTGEITSSDGITSVITEAKMLRSTDGVTWTAGGGTGLGRISSGPVYYAGRWIVAGVLATQAPGGPQKFSRALSTSKDGGATWSIEWQDPETFFGFEPNGLAVFGGRLVILGGPEAPVVSTADLVAFRADLPAQVILLNAVVASTDHVVAVGRFGRIITSNDGANWTPVGTSTVEGILRAAAFGDGQWIVAGDRGLAASPDGITWRTLPAAAGFTEGSIAFGNGRFVAGTISGHVGVSTDQGATWTDSGAVGVRGQLAFAQGRFVSGFGLASSTDGFTWTARAAAPGGTGVWTRVFTIDGVFYAIGTMDPNEEKDGVIARSTDGLTWTVVATMKERLVSVGGRAGLLVACAYMGEIWTSTDGLTWTKAAGAPLMTFGPAASTLWVGDSLVAVTLFGQVVTSDDGVVWTKDEFASSGMMLALAAGNGQVLAVGNGGAIWEVGAARFTRQPENRTVVVGNSVTFSVGVTGKEPLSYQWLKDGSPVGQGQISSLAISGNTSAISGAKTRTLTIPAAKISDAGSYRVVVTNSLGSTESSPASLVVSQSATLPGIFSQPQSKTVDAGASVTFSVVATGDAPLTYQWRKDSGVIVGATSPSYTIAVASPSYNGTYSVVVSNSAGTVTSNGAMLTVNASVPATRFGNIATRAYATTNNGVTIGGFVITGSNSKQVLMRAVGPSLTSQGIGASEVLADPIIELHRGADTLATNDNWSDSLDAMAITAAAARVGATALDPNDAKSAAMLMTLDPGIYSFIAKGTNNTSGIVLLEVYDADAGGSSFSNIASRVRCTTNNGVAIGGFVISGNVAKQVLMRAVGPTLTTQGIAAAEVLQDPRIELHRGAETLATNDTWSENENASAIVSVGARIGATPFAPSDTNSAALLMTLQPGVYSFIVRGKNDTSGIVLVEVYDAN